MTNRPWKGRGQSRTRSRINITGSESGDQFYNFAPHDLWIGWLETSNFVRGLTTRSTNPHVTNCPQVDWSILRDVLKFWQKPVNISKMVRDRKEYVFNRRLIRMAYHVAPTAVTLNGREGHSPIAGLFRCISSAICAAFYKFSTDSVFAWSLSDSWASCLISECRWRVELRQSGRVIISVGWAESKI